jgi:hypothetical protein
MSKKHDTLARARMSAAAKKRWAELTPEERRARTAAARAASLRKIAGRHGDDI